MFAPKVDTTDYRKGIRLIFLNYVKDLYCGNTNEPNDAGEDPEKSSLFFLTNHSSLLPVGYINNLGMELIREEVRSLVKRFNF